MRKVPPPRGPATEPGMKRDSSKTMSSAGGEEDAGSGRTIPQDSHQSPSSRARTDHGVAPSHGDYTDGTVLTDDAVVETEVPIAMPVNPDDDEENRAEEAQQQVIYHPAIEVHPKDDELPPPTRWKRNVVISVAALSVCVIIAAAVGGVMASKNNDKGARNIGIPEAPDPPTLAPTRPPAPLNCTIENLGPVYAADHCPWCDFGVARDGDTVILVTSDAWSEDPPEMEVIVGPFRLASNMPDHPITEMAFSDDSFVASDPLDWDGGVVYITSKGPSGEILDDTIKLRPAPENVDPLGQFGTTIAVDGDVLVVGAPNDDDLAGSAFVFRRNADDRSKWEEEAKFKPPDFGVQNFGNSVLVKNDGNFVVVAADYYGDENKGAVFFYKFDDESNLWKNFTALVNDECDGNFGSSLAFSGDDGLLIGCPMYDDARGAVYYYQRSDKDDGSWQYKEIQRITAKDGEKLDKFGGSSQHLPMSLNEEFVLIGTYDEECGVDESLYLFSKFDNAWLEVAQINGPEDSTYFGGKSVIAGDRILISSWENTYSYEMTCEVDRMTVFE